MIIDFLPGFPLAKNQRKFGIYRYVSEIFVRLKKFGLIANEIPKPRIRNSFLDLLYMLLIYPAQYFLEKKSGIAHIASHTFSLLLLNPVFIGKKTIVTVYDIYPYLNGKGLPLHKRLLSELNMLGLKRADKIIAISEFTKSELIRHLGLAGEKIAVVCPAVDHSRFRRLEVPSSFRKKYGLTGKDKIILYVGSEEPRQNLRVLVKALSLLKESGEDFTFVKIGVPGWPRGRDALQDLLIKHSIGERTKLIDYAEDDELPLFYNAASVLVYPCEYAGFGLPPLEAMACGCPVIASKSSSIPEVVGNAGIMLDARDAAGFFKGIRSILTDPSARRKYSRLGRARAATFKWETAAEKTASLYKQMV